MQDCVWVYIIIFNNLLCWNWQASSSTDGKLKMWVYGVAAGAFVLLIFIVSMIYLAWWVDEFHLPCLSSSSPPLFLSPPTLSWSTPFTSLSSFFSASCESSSLCAKVHHSLKAREPDTNGTATWTGQNSHEMVYICPECQELTQNRSS